jgi:hypothetical protein
LSVLDEVRGLEKRVVSRLKELRPLVEEYEQLRQVADRLGVDVNAAGEKQPAARKRRSAPRRTSSRRAPRGTKAVGAERRARVLELIEQRPGITVPDLSRELAVEPPPLYRTVRKLQSEGVIKKDGKSLKLA